MEQIKITLNIDIHSKLELLSEIITSLRKDMLAMEEELRAFKTQQMIKNKLAEDAIKKTTLTTSGTKIVYKTIPKPNETYIDLEKKPRGWHY